MRTNLIFFDSFKESNKGWVRWIIVVISLIILDLIRFNVFNNYMEYKVTKNPINIYSSIFVWFLVGAALAVQNEPSYLEALIYGVLVGLVIYGVYNFTNYSILEGYSLKGAVINTLGGILICMFSISILWLLYWKK